MNAQFMTGDIIYEFEWKMPDVDFATSGIFGARVRFSCTENAAGGQSALKGNHLLTKKSMQRLPETDFQDLRAVAPHLLN